MFYGFPIDSTDFLAELTENNRKDWFTENKKRFKSSLEAPGREFAESVVDKLGRESWDSKVFRIYRDLRFSKDKTPYNTHLRIGFFCEGKASLFFSLEAEELILGAGVFGFSKEGLARYRQAVDGESGLELERIVKELQGRGFRLDDPELKRVPKGFDTDHLRAEFLRRKSLSLWLDKPLPKAIYTAKSVEHCLAVFQELQELRNWLEGVL